MDSPGTLTPEELTEMCVHQGEKEEDATLESVQRMSAKYIADSKKKLKNSTGKIKNVTTTAGSQTKAQVKMMPAASNPDLVIPT